jgi:GNAT superfamily N-acetyltransferase
VNDADLRAASDRNLLAGFALLSRHRPDGRALEPRRFGSVWAFPCQRRAAFFNPVVVLSPPAPGAVDEAVRWLRSQDVEPSVRAADGVIDDAFLELTRRLGFVRDERAQPGMALQPLPPSPPRPPGLTIEAASSATLDRWYRANAAGFDMSDSGLELVHDLNPPGIVVDPDIRLLGGYLDEEPVACSKAIRSGNVVGIYAVGTSERARRLGIGTAMTWAAIEVGRQWGCEVGVLQASEMGQPVYRAMGFRVVTSYVNFSPAPT